MNSLGKKVRLGFVGLVVAAGLALAPSAFARSHFSLGLNIGLPGIGVGYYGGGGYYAPPYAGYYAPAYYAPAYAYGPAYYPAYGGVSIYSGGYYGRGYHGGYYDRGYHGRGGDYGHRASYYNRGGYNHR